MTEASTQFRQLLEERRAVRRFQDQPVPDEVIRHCLESAVLAPSSCNLQPWSFQVIRDPQLLQQLHSVCLGQTAAQAPLLIAILARPDNWQSACAKVLSHWPEAAPPKAVETFYRKVAPLQYNQGKFGELGLLKRLLNLFRGWQKPIMRTPNSLSQMRLWSVKSSALAAQNLMLALQSHGYSSCPMEGFDERRLRKLLPIPKQAIPIMLLAVGKAGERAVYNPRLRFPLQDCVSWH